MLNRLVSSVFLVFIALTSILFFFIALLLRLISYPFDRRLRLLHLFTCFWASCYTWTMPAWRIRIEGREHVRKNMAYVITSNHQSQLDILIAFRLFFHYKWVSKIEIFRVPLSGWKRPRNRASRTSCSTPSMGCSSNRPSAIACPLSLQPFRSIRRRATQ
jgi:1-acyl-sn-glycerol-3-phosphate acyltransferase